MRPPVDCLASQPGFIEVEFGEIGRQTMGIRFFCPNGHKLNVKSFQAGQRGICPSCGAKVQIPEQSTRPSSRQANRAVAESDANPGAVPQEPALELAFPAPSSPSKSETPGSDSAWAIPVAKPAELETRATEPVNAATSAPEQPVSAAASSSGALAPGDPLSQAPEMVWYVRPPAGGQYGPASGPIMRTWLAEGRVPPDALVWREGWEDWRSAWAIFSELRSGDKNPLPAITAKTPPLPGAHTGSYHGPTHRRSKRTNIGIIVLLAVAVIILLGVLFWVLTSGPELQTMSRVPAGPVVLAAICLRGFGRRVPSIAKPER